MLDLFQPPIVRPTLPVRTVQLCPEDRPYSKIEQLKAAAQASADKRRLSPEERRRRDAERARVRRARLRAQRPIEDVIAARQRQLEAMRRNIGAARKISAERRRLSDDVRRLKRREAMARYRARKRAAGAIGGNP